MIALSCTCKPRYVVFIIRNFYLFLYFTHRLESEISLVILIFFSWFCFSLDKSKAAIDGSDYYFQFEEVIIKT